VFEAGRFGGVLALGADRQIRTCGTPELAFRLERRPDAPHVSSASITLGLLQSWQRRYSHCWEQAVLGGVSPV